MTTLSVDSARTVHDARADDSARADAPPGACWVIVDPRHFETGLFDALVAAFATYGVLGPECRCTSEGETAAQLATAAVLAQATRVVVIGDEVTIRAVASALANTGIPLGIVPVSSGLRLARWIGVPTDHDAAIAAALGGSTALLDLMRVTIDSGHTTCSFITVGVEGGPSARGAERSSSVRVDRDPRPSFGATATVDQQRPSYSRSAACVIGIGSRVVPPLGPHADDRLLHVSMLRARRGVGARKRHRSDAPPARRRATPEDGRTGQRVLLVLDEVKPYYLDGALAGHATTLSAEIQPAALRFMVPPRG